MAESVLNMYRCFLLLSVQQYGIMISYIAFTLYDTSNPEII